MLVDDDSETGSLRVLDDIIELRQPLRLKPVLRIHELECLEVEADEIEAGVPDLGEVPPLEAAPARVRPVRVVTEDVDAAVERLVRLSQHRRQRTGGERGRCGKRGEDE